MIVFTSGSLLQAHMVLQNIGMAAGSGLLPPESHLLPDINMLLWVLCYLFSV